MKQAVGTSLLLISVNCVSGLAGYLGRVPIDWRGTASFTLMAVAGVVAGTRVARWVSPIRLRQAFALFLVTIGLFMLVPGHAPKSAPQPMELTR